MQIENLNLNLLRTFYNVAKFGNITETADKTFTSQPAISRSIKQLENEFNTQLFYRTLNGVELTEKGKILYNFIEETFEELNKSISQIKEMDNYARGRLSIGVPSQIASIFLFEEIARFHRAYPNIEVTIMSKTTSELMKLLKSHDIDFVIDTTPVNIKSDNYKIINLKEYKNCFFASNKLTQNQLDNIKSLKDLEELPLVLPVAKTANRVQLDSLFKKHNIKPKDVLNIHTSEMIISAVKQNAGIGYVLEDLISNELKLNNVKIIDKFDDLPTTNICLVYESLTLSKTSKFFIEKYLNIEL